MIDGQDDFVAAEIPLQPLIRRQQRIIRGKHVFDATVETNLPAGPPGGSGEEECREEERPAGGDQEGDEAVHSGAGFQPAIKIAGCRVGQASAARAGPPKTSLIIVARVGWASPTTPMAQRWA